MIATEEPILSRLDRLDTILRHLEDHHRGVHGKSPRSSYASTHSSGIASDGHDASAETTPRSLDSHCRSIDDVITETQLKGTLLDRLDHVEDQVIQLCAHLESELEADSKRMDDTERSPSTPTKKKSGLKQLVKSCIKSKKKNSNT